MRTLWVGLTAVLGGLLVGAVALAADPSPQDKIHGQDVMGDKGQTGPDGWSWAPTTRDQAPGDQKNGQSAANARATPNTQPSPGEGKKLSAGDDPGTPAKTEAHGPGTMDSAVARKP